MLKEKKFIVQVDPDHGEHYRLDQFLTNKFPGISRRYLQEHIKAGKVLVNGKKAKKSGHLKNSDEVLIQEFIFPDERQVIPNPELEIPTVHDDDQTIVFDKPAGLAVHPNNFEQTDAMVNALIAKYPDVVDVGDDRLRSGVVHRLDVNTSGLIIMAKTEEAYRSLREQFDNRKVEKQYLALVVGEVPESGSVDWPIAHHPKDPKKMMASKTPRPDLKYREAETIYEIEDSYKGYTLLRVKTKTGRMHQVRVHLSALGWPLAGDHLYQQGKHRNIDKTGLKRHFLHACFLAFSHPETSKRLEFKSELTEELVNVLANLPKLS
jgi:23S rRNA pseudouridine1911/1915/1917 synthase